MWHKILEKIKNPSIFIKISTFVLTIISAVFSIVIAISAQESHVMTALSYLLFVVAGLSLAYSIYIIIKSFHVIKKKIVAFLEKHDFTYLLLRNFGFRTIIFAIGSFFMSVLFGLFNGYMGIRYRSIWYGALAAYYIALVVLRGGILIYHKRKISKDNDLIKEEYEKIIKYRTSGIVMLVLNIALSVAIGQMIFSDAHFTFVGWTIFAFAAYAFYKITVAIITFIRAQKHSDLTVRAIRNINLADACVSILALQTALLNAFGNGSMNISLMNTVTGIIVSLVSVSIGIFMIVNSIKHLNKFKRGKNNEQQ